MTAISRTSRVLGLAIVACGALLFSPAFALAQATDPEPSSPPTIPPPPPTPTTPAAEPPTTQPAQMPPADLPPAQKLLDQAVEAMGGKEALDAIKTTSIEATIDSPMGEIALNMKTGEDGRFFVEQVVPGMGSVTMGSDGEHAWVNTPMAGGYQLLDETQTQMMRQQSNMFNMVRRMHEEYPEMTTVDKADFKGAAAWKVKLIDKEGDEHFAFFDPETHLMRGMERTEDSPMGAMKVVLSFEGWEQKDDVKVFTTITADQMGQEMVIKINEIEFNKVEASDFELPEEVEAMVEQRKGGGGAQPGAATRPATQPMTDDDMDDDDDEDSDEGDGMPGRG